MSKHNSTHLGPGDNGYVGRGHPPEHGKIRKGETRNPWGRKGKAGQGTKQIHLDFALAVAEELARPVTSKDGKSYTRVQVAINGLMKGVYAGDKGSIKLLLDLHDKYPLPKPVDDQEQLDIADQAILADYQRELLLSHGVDPDAPPSASSIEAIRSEDENIYESEEVNHA